MAVVRNLMIRIGADYSEARKGMQGATRELGRFKRDTTRTVSSIKGKNGIGGISSEFRTLGGNVSSSLSRMRGAKGIGGVVSELKTLRPIMGSATTGLRGMGAAAGGAGAAFGGAALGVGAFVAVLGIATIGIYNASQAAVKFEADLGRLNMQLGGNSREFLQWARSTRLAKQSAVEMGSTYSVLLSSFIQDNQELSNQTKHIVNTTRIVASATGRTIEDTTERMRSGLLGNTEAIEDLGIFVNVAMIESTNAFKKFANGKSWDQLDFRVQQQIRLAAILEQAYARYGDELQNNVMTKQTDLMEQLKDVKLNLSQAFLPIWDAALPALQMLAQDIAYVTEQLARFTYWLRGWDYDELTQGTDRQTDAVNNQSGAYGDLANQARAARKELANFDNLNILGSGSGNGTGGGGGSGGGAPNYGDGNNGSGGLPPQPPMNMKRWRIEFDPPNPPDAGAGAVATAVDTTMNGMITSTKLASAAMWGDLKTEWQLGSAELQGAWSGMWIGMRTQTGINVPAIKLQITDLKNAVSFMSAPLAKVKADWKGALSDMQQNLNAYRPYLEWGWKLIGLSVNNLKSPLAEIKKDWTSTLSDMSLVATQKLSPILTVIGNVVSGFNSLKQALTGSKTASPAIDLRMQQELNHEKHYGSVTTPEGSSLVDPLAGQMSYIFSAQSLKDAWNKIKEEAAKPQNQIAAGIYGTVVPVGKLGPFIDDAIKMVANLFKGAGGAVPAFANGAVVYGPTLAMVGDNPNASADPEVISPLSKLEGMIGGDNREVVGVLKEILRAIQTSGDGDTATIKKSDLARAAAFGINDMNRRAGKTILNT